MKNFFAFSSVLIVIMVSIPSIADAGLQFEKKGGVVFANLAPGEVEADLSKNFPVKIVYASRSGIPYAGIYTRIFNASGIAVFRHLCEKPWLFLKLPVGDYHVVAVDRKRKTAIRAFEVKKERQTVVKLEWSKEIVGY